MIHVIGIGLEGVSGLSESVRQLIDRATLLIGSARHLEYFPNHPANCLNLGDFRAVIQTLRDRLNLLDQTNESCIVVLTSGDPLFFGLGRLLLAELPSDRLTFHPHLSSVQLAFSRVKLPWQEAALISAHGRSLEELTRSLQQGTETIAVLTDPTNTPAAIAHLLRGLDLPTTYKIWVCENLGGVDEQVNCFAPEELDDRSFAPLNVVILHRSTEANPLNLDSLPAFGLSDHLFLSFHDRPGLMTKREVRILVLAELGLHSAKPQVIWDIGAGTGSVSVEMARLCGQSKVYAIEQTAAGISLIEQNAVRFGVEKIIPVHAKAPDRLEELPDPDRVFIGGSSGQLNEILDQCSKRLAPAGTIVLAMATLENLMMAMSWLQAQTGWNHRLLQINLSRSTPIAGLTRFTPLNPVTLLTLERDPKNSANNPARYQ
ncbi:precorrin-6y C5,15-methyltransferase (decarboxylating) subunit CbiE [Leptolyngbya ohadii]|uniref:precorrin-6y C5,15-methyltransferase (decarboxylating) subunit CbiE n=1 Tax=Leptolyngbya ohadii TaxID=1962290 RepID=UPI000B59DCF8|nr:precorrin-6y C5,15-methyltransferase (decarboxylating) subunit CbiE [Leptolyngbya ohadii]